MLFSRGILGLGLFLALPAFAQDAIIIQAVGDLNLSGKAIGFIEKEGVDYPYKGVRAVLREGDANFVNLEAPFTERGAPYSKDWTFRSKPAWFDGLVAAGFNFFSLANNHSMDYGPEGLFDTMDLIRKRGLAAAGAGANLEEARRPGVLTVKGRRVALLAYSLTFPEDFHAGPDKPGNPFGHVSHVRKDVTQARKESDLVMVSFHWGAELSQGIKPYQVELGREAIKAGADMVFGHHPHILQGVEIYKGRPIFYSLGNFVFGSYSVNAKRAVLARVVVNGEGRVESVQAVPLLVDNFRVDFQTRVARGVLAESVLRELEALSALFGTVVDVKDGIGWIRGR